MAKDGKDWVKFRIKRRTPKKKKKTRLQIPLCGFAQEKIRIDTSAPFLVSPTQRIRIGLRLLTDH